MGHLSHLPKYIIMSKKLLSLAFILSFLGCAPSLKVTSSWVNKDITPENRKTYKTIFISAIISKLEVRTEIENDLAAAVEKRRLVAIKSLDKFPPVTTGKAPTNEEVLEIVKNLGADAILTTSVVDKTSETRYVPGSGAAYSPGFYGGFRGYYGGAYGYYNPGYYTTDKIYFIETNLFDAATGAVLWSSQSQLTNPSGVEKTAKYYTELMIKQMEKDGILKPIK
jgi:hypothetical protein